jgi:predicted metal-dependent HD superfamily phosphohydrolase
MDYVASAARWFGLWHRIEAQGDALVIYRMLMARHSESHRAYHTLSHIQDCLVDFADCRHLATNPNAVEAAIWFHDAVYDPKAKDNEEQSAVLATETLKRALLSGRFQQTVATLIMATKHAAIPTDPDAQMLVDIDLAILGKPEERFNAYERQIRTEYQWVPLEEFAVVRARILKSFLDRPSIYATQFFRDSYERTASQNITRSLARLNACW